MLDSRYRLADGSIAAPRASRGLKGFSGSDLGIISFDLSISAFRMYG
jgi:hypothetical protein